MSGSKVISIWEYFETKLRFGFWFTILAFGLALFAAIIGFSDLSQNTSTPWDLVLVSILTFYILILLCVTIWREYAHRRKARLAAATEKLHMVAHNLRNAHAAINKNDRTAADTAIQESLSFFQSAFSLISGTSCRSSIKTIDYEGDPNDERSWIVETFCRGGQSTGNPNPKKDSVKKDLLVDNSDFLIIFRAKDNKFISNNLLKEKGYRNSHWPDQASDYESFVKNKQYEYISTIIWPIRYVPPACVNEVKLIGFLCVDTMEKNAFTNSYDMQIGSMVADTLYSCMSSYRNIFQDTATPESVTQA